MAGLQGGGVGTYSFLNIVKVYLVDMFKNRFRKNMRQKKETNGVSNC